MVPTAGLIRRTALSLFLWSRHSPAGQACRLRLTAMGNSDRSIQQACLAHALGNPFGVRRILEWQTIDMIFKRISRIDLLELLPNAPSLLCSAQMAQGRCEEGARQIRAGIGR